MKSQIVLVGCFFVLANWIFVSSKTVHDLHKDMFMNYSVHRRPVRNRSHSVLVNVSMNLMSIESLDINRQHLTTSGWIMMRWVDEFLSWDQSEYEGEASIATSYKNIWTPDLLIANSHLSYGQIGNDRLKLQVFSNGQVQWFVGDLMRTTCLVDVTRVPFDTQECEFELFQWRSTISDVDLKPFPETITFETFQASGEWEVDGTSSDVIIKQGEKKFIIFSLKLRRLRAYYVLTVILPLCILSSVNLLVFLVPRRCEERLTLAISVLLSYAVFVTYINDFLPEKSDRVAIISVYMDVMLFVKAMTVAATIWTLNLQRKPPKRTGLIYVLCFLWWRNRFKTTGHSNPGEICKDKELPLNDIELVFCDTIREESILTSKSGSLQDTSITSFQDDSNPHLGKEDDTQIEGTKSETFKEKKVADVLDVATEVNKTLFYLFSFTSLVITAVLFGVMAT